MRRNLIVGVVASVAVALSGAALAQAQFGTAEEAKAMLVKAVAAVKADKAKALDMFNKGEGGFLDRDLYPFCGNTSDGTILAVYNPIAKQNIGKGSIATVGSGSKLTGLATAKVRRMNRG